MSSTTEEKQQEAVENGVPSPQNTEETTSASEKGRVPIPRFKKPRLIIIIVSSVLLTVVLFFCFRYVIPYGQAKKAFESRDYLTAYQKYASAGEYMDASEKAVVAEKAYHYAAAQEAFLAEDYTLAHTEFELAGDYEDAVQMSRTSVLAGYYLAGTKAIADKNYEEAINCFSKAKGYLDGRAKWLEALNLYGEELLSEKKYTEAAFYFSIADNQERHLECGKLLAGIGKYEESLPILEEHSTLSSEAMQYLNYAKGMLCLNDKNFAEAAKSLKAAGDVLNAEEKRDESLFSLAEVCLHDGYLNKAKAIYEALPADYELNGHSATERIELLEKNTGFLNLVGTWHAIKGQYRVQANSTTSSYYYYWYNDSYSGSVTVRCPYNDNGTFGVVGTATYLCYQNFSKYSYNLKTDLETYSFNKKDCSSVPSNLGSSRCGLQYSGNQFKLNYKYVNDSSNLFWNYTYTSNMTYGNRSQLAEDTFNP